MPDALQAIVYQALAKDPALRYQSAQEIVDDLAALRISSPGAPTRTFAPSLLRRYVKDASQSALSSPVKPLARRPWLLALLAVPLLAALALLVPSFRENTFARLFGPAEKHIAVLPLTTIGSEPANVALVDGLMDSLTSRLSNLDSCSQSLWVVPAGEVRRRKVIDASSARREFAATLAVSGSVERIGTAVRLILNLIDATKMRQLGSAEVEDRTGDFSALQDAAVARSPT